MKKVLFPILVLLILCSCNTNTKINPIVKEIKFTAQTLWDSTEYTLDTETDKNLKTTVTVTSPEKIRNLKFIFSGDVVFLYYLDLEHKISLNELSVDSPLRILFEGLKSASKENAVISENGTYYIKFSVDNTEYKLFFSETGLPQKIADNRESNIIFKNVTILN